MTTPASRREVAFILDNLPDWETLAASVPDGVDMVVLEASDDVLAQMVRWTQSHSGYDAIHLFSHGTQASLQLGREAVTETSLQDAGVQAELAQLGAALKPDGDLLLYGCNVAEGAQGLSFVEHLAALTGADVAASSDLTGAAEQGGDWVLESSLGNIQTVALHPDAYSAVLTNTAPTLSTSLSFATKVDISAGTSAPNSVTSADIDGDTKPDLIASLSGIDKVSVLRNTSTGSGSVTFDTHTDFGSGTGPTSVFTADIDGDGQKDVITANATNNTVSVLKNTSISGSISFDAKADFTVGSNPVSVTSFDIDKDGKLDLLVANNNNDSTNAPGTSVSVLRNTSSGGTISFATESALTFSSHKMARVTNADVDGDGWQDLIVLMTEGSGIVSVYRNTSTSGSVSFAARQDFSTTPIGARSVTSADVDGDGKPDLVVGTAYGGSDYMSVLRNTSTVGVVNFASSINTLLAKDASPMSVISMDANGDGKLDVVTSNYGHSNVAVFKNTGTGTGVISFDTAATFATNSQPSSVTSADVDRDGKPDLIAASNNTAYLSVLRNTSGLAAFTVTEDVASNLLFTGTPFADAEGDNLTVTLSIADGTITGSAVTGITLGGTTIARTFAGTVADLNSYFTTAGNITYTTATDNNTARTLTVNVSDSALSASATSIVNITAVNDAPVLNGFISLDGTGDFIETGISTAVDLNQADFTLEAWIKTTGTSEGILTKSNGDSGWNPGEKSFYIDASGKLMFVGWGVGYLQSATIVNDGAWHHVAVVWDWVGSGTSGGKLYVDGIDRTTSSYTNSNMADNAGNTVRIGQRNFGDEAPKDFTGQIDDVRIWNVARTAAEISANTSARLDANTSGLVANFLLDNTASSSNATYTGSLNGNAQYAASPLANQAATVSSLFGFTFASNTFIDVDTGQTLTYSATKSDGTALPSWLSFNAGSRSFSGTPTAGDAGTLSVKVTATDNGTGPLSVSAPFDIAVSTVPSVSSIVRAGSAAALTNATSVDYTVTFSESVTGVTTDDFTLTKTATANGSVTAVAGSGSSYTVTVTSVTGDGSLGLNLNSSGTGITSASSVAIASGYSSGETYTLDHTAPTVTHTSAAYTSATNTLVLTGTNFNTLLESSETASTDIKARLDWSKLSWDINGDNATTADVSFALGDISSATVTDATHLTIVLSSVKGAALEATSDFGKAIGGAGLDTLDISAGFARDAAGNAATTDAAANAALTVTTPAAGDSVIDLGTSGKLIAPAQVEGKWYYYWDRSGNGTSGVEDQTTHDVLDGIFKYDSTGNLNPAAGTDTTESYRYGTINGVQLALPTANGGLAYPQGMGTQNGTSATGTGTSNNSSFEELLAIWDTHTTAREQINPSAASRRSGATITGLPLFLHRVIT